MLTAGALRWGCLPNGCLVVRVEFHCEGEESREV